MVKALSKNVDSFKKTLFHENESAHADVTIPSMPLNCKPLRDRNMW